MPAAVGRVLEQVLADRLARARALDGRFAQELAAHVARFTQEGGKRTRSQLVWWAMRACGGAGEDSVAAALRIGAALELLQTCALVHDDVMDGSTQRRGRPALHAEVRDRHAEAAPPSRAARFGEAAAILAGDLALAWADDVVAELALDPWTATVVHRLWSDMRTEMVAGQFLDLQGQLTGSRSQPRAAGRRASRARSTRWSGPSRWGPPSPAPRPAPSRRCARRGAAWAWPSSYATTWTTSSGDPARTGKPCGGDIREGKPTYLVAVATARAAAASDRHARDVLERALGDPELTPRGVGGGTRRAGAHRRPGAVEAKIGRLAAQGLRHFDGAPLAPAAGGQAAGAAGRGGGILRSRRAAGPPASRAVPRPRRPRHAGGAAMTRTVKGRTDHVVVVGAGFAGLSAALHLLGAGRRVTVVERDPLPGGRAAAWTSAATASTPDRPC